MAVPNVERILHTLVALMEKFYLSAERLCNGWIVSQDAQFEWGQFDFVCEYCLSGINLHDFLTVLTLNDWDQEYKDFHDNCMNEWDGFCFYDVEMAHRKWNALYIRLLSEPSICGDDFVV